MNFWTMWICGQQNKMVKKHITKPLTITNWMELQNHYVRSWIKTCRSKDCHCKWNLCDSLRNMRRKLLYTGKKKFIYLVELANQRLRVRICIIAINEVRTIKIFLCKVLQENFCHACAKKTPRFTKHTQTHTNALSSPPRTPVRMMHAACSELEATTGSSLRIIKIVFIHWYNGIFCW